MASLKSFLDEYEAGLSAQQPTQQRTFDLSRFDETEPVAPKTAKDPSLLRRAGDFGVDVLKAVPTLVEAGAGLAGMIPGVHYAADPVGQFAGGVAEGLGNRLYSDKRLEEEAAIQQRMTATQDQSLMTQAKTAASAYTDNPYALLGMVGQSLGLAKGGAVVGKKALSAIGKPVKSAEGVVDTARAATAAQVGEGVVAGGLVAANAAQENPDEFAARYYGLPAGALTTMISRGANKLMPDTADVDTLLAGGARTATGKGVVDTAKNVGKTAFKEGVLEEALQSGQEQMFTNLSTDQPVLRGVGGAMASGAMAGSIMGGAFGFKQRKPAGEMTNDDLIADVDGVLAPPAPADDPTMQGEWDAMQQEFALNANRGATETQLDRDRQWREMEIERAARQTAEMGQRNDAEIARQMDADGRDPLELTGEAPQADPLAEVATPELTRMLGLVEQGIVSGQPMVGAENVMQRIRDVLATREQDQPVDTSTLPLFDADGRLSPEATIAERAARAGTPDMTADEVTARLQDAAAPAADGQATLMAGQMPAPSPIVAAQGGTPVAAVPTSSLKGLPKGAQSELSRYATDPQQMAAAVADMFYTKAEAGSSAAYVFDKLPALYQQLTGQPLPETRAAAAPLQRAAVPFELQGETDAQAAANYARAQEVAAAATPLPSVDVSPKQAGFLTPDGEVDLVQPGLNRRESAKQTAARKYAAQQQAARQADRKKIAGMLGENIPAPVVVNETPVDAPQAALQLTGDQQTQEAQNGPTPTVVEAGGVGLRSDAGAGAGAGGARAVSGSRNGRGSARAPAAGDAQPVVVGSGAGERAAGVAPPQGSAASPPGFSFKDMRDAYIAADRASPGPAGRDARLVELTGIAEIEQIGTTKQQREQAKKYLDSIDVNPKEAATARRQAQDAIGREAAQERRQAERDKAIAARQKAQAKQLKEMQDAEGGGLSALAQKIRNARTTDKSKDRERRFIPPAAAASWDRMMEEMDALAGKAATKVTQASKREGSASGTATAPVNPNVHTPRSLAEALVEHFGETMRDAILAGRVKIVADQTHLAAMTGDASRRGKITQGMYYYNPSKPAGSGTVYFVAANLARTQQGYTAFDVALHEIGEHAGMEQMLGKQNYQQLLGSIRKAMAVQTPKTQFERDVAAAMKKLLADQQGKPHEVLAYMIQHTPDSTGLQRMWAAIKAFAARFGLLPDSMKDAATMRALAAGATAKWLKGVATQPATSRQSIASAASGIADPETRKIFTNFGDATTAAKKALASVEKMSPADWQGTTLKGFRTLSAWITKHHMVKMFDKWFDGALAKNAEADTIQQAMSARVAQLFNEPHNRFKALPQELQGKVAQLMELTEMKLDPRKKWDAHAHLHGLTGAALAQVKQYHNRGAQWWGQLGATEQGRVAQGVYNDLAAMNEALYTMELAVSTYNMVHANAGPAKDLTAFAGSPTDRFLQSGEVHGSIEAAHAYWKGVLEGYTAQLNTYVAEQRGLLPVKSQTDPDVLAAERKMLKGVQDERVRRTIRAQLRTRTDKLTDEQKKVVRHLSPLEAQLRMAGDTVETFRHAPYFHLGRFGDEFVSFRVRTGEGEQADPAAMTHVQQALAKEFPDVAIRTDATDPHIFARFESVDQAAAFRERAVALQKEGWLMQPGTKDKNNKDLGEIRQGTKQEIISGYHTAGPNWLSRVVESIQAEGFDDEVTKQMVAHVRSMYLDALPDTAAIKVKQRREGRPGWHKDMMRNYAHRTRVGANKVASLAAEPTRTQSFAGMNDALFRAETDPKMSKLQQNKMSAIVSELQKRDSNQMSVPHTPGVDMLRALNHAYFLGLSPSYLLIQMTQLGVLTWPELAKRHGFVKAAKALGEVSGIAFKVVGTVLREGYARQGLKGVADMVITGDMLERAGLSGGDAAFLVKVMAAGKLDIGNAARNVGRVAEGEAGSEALKIATAMGYASEILTRTIAALAAKRLHKGTEAELMKYAIGVVDESMMDYSTQNEGRMMGKQGVAGVASTVMFSFMKYQAQLLEKMYREVHAAYAKQQPGETAEVFAKRTAEARTFLGGHLMAMMALAGSLGMPFATVIAKVADELCGLFGDGHCDSKIALRNMTADVFGHDIEPLLSKGVVSRLAGFDVSDRAGEANILPFSKFLTDKHAMDERLSAMAMDSWGAPTAMIGNALKAAEKFGQGDLLGGMQEAVPLALKGPIKAFEMSEKGYTDKAGNVLPMEAGAYDMLLQTLGLNPGEKADYQQAKFAQSVRSGVLGREGTQIRQKLATAIEQGDSEGVRKWSERAQEFDTTNPAHAILPRMAATLQRRAREGAQAKATGTTLGVSLKDIEAQQLTSFMRP